MKSLALLQVTLGQELRSSQPDVPHVERLCGEILSHPGLALAVAAHAKRKRKIVAAQFQPAYQPGMPQRLEITKNGKRRTVWAPADHDYSQHLYLLLGIVSPIAEQTLGPYTHAFRQGHSTDTAINQVITAVKGTSGTNPQILQEDLRKCFHTLPLQIAEQHLPSTTYATIRAIHERYNQALGRFGKTASGLPQGTPLAPAIANIIIETILAPVRSRHQRTGVTIVTYGDDISIIGPRGPARDAKKDLSATLSKAGMKLHPDKSRTVSPKPGETLQLLGFEISWKTPGERPTIRPKPGAYSKLTEKIAKAITQKEVNAIIRGWTQAYALSNHIRHTPDRQQAIALGKELLAANATRTFSPRS